MGRKKKTINKITQGFNAAMSPVPLNPKAKIVHHPPIACRALVSLPDMQWLKESAKNDMPYLNMTGQIVQLNALNEKFPNNVTSIAFLENRPNVTFKYNLSPRQLGQLAEKGFWHNGGVRIAEVVQKSNLELDVEVQIDEISAPDAEIPLLNCTIMHPFNNQFDERIYDLMEYVSAIPPEEENVEKIREQQADIDYDNSYARDISQRIDDFQLEQEQQTPTDIINQEPLSQEDLHIQALNLEVADNAARQYADLRSERDNQKTVARNIQQAMVAENVDTASQVESADKPESGVQAVEKQSDSLVQNTDTFETSGFEQYEPASESSVDAAVSEIAANLFGNVDNAAEDINANKKKDDDTRRGGGTGGSNTGSTGVDNGGYTFEDMDTAQHEMREDEGHGNEKQDDKSEDKDNEREESKPDEKSVSNAPSAAKFANVRVHQNNTPVAPNNDKSLGE